MNKKLYNSIVRGISESLQKSLYEGLFDDENDILQFVDKDFKPEDRYEGLGFGQSFNGKEISTI